MDNGCTLRDSASVTSDNRSACDANSNLVIGKKKLLVSGLQCSVELVGAHGSVRLVVRVRPKRIPSRDNFVRKERQHNAAIAIYD